MEYNQFEVQEELPQKEFKKHPLVAIILFSFSILSIIVAIVLTLLTGMEQLYTCFYAVSLLTLIIGFNSLLRFKGFCLIFYPIIVLYSIISAYAFASDKSILEFQFPIIAASVIAIYFIQALYETIRTKNAKIIILPSIMLVPAIVLISLFTIVPLKILSLILAALFIPIIVFELLIAIVELKKLKNGTKEPEVVKEEDTVETEEIKKED
jgi:hypothetical protein